jgi:hypothetical protein
VSVVREAPSNSAITDDDNFGPESKCNSCQTTVILCSSYVPGCSMFLFAPGQYGP